MPTDEIKKAELLEMFIAASRGEKLQRRFRTELNSEPPPEIEELIRTISFVRRNFREGEYTQPRPGAVEKMERRILEAVGATEEKEVGFNSSLVLAYSHEPHGSDSELLQSDYRPDGKPSPRCSLELLLKTSDGQITEKTVDLDGGNGVIIGRGCKSDIKIPGTSRQVSRTHAELRLNDGRVEIIDLQSTNGTFLNGERIESAQLGEGDVIRLGDATIEIKRIHCR